MFEEILAKIAGSFKKHNIAYMIIGGQAVLVYGEPRLTRDIDVALDCGTENLKTVLEIAKELSLKPIPKDITRFVKDTFVLPAMDDASGIRVDFIFSFTPYEAQAIKRAKKVKIIGTDVFFASVEDLVIHKIFAGRPRDLEDARVVILKNPDMDRAYIRKWLKRFDAVSGRGEFSGIFKGILKDI